MSLPSLAEREALLTQAQQLCNDNGAELVFLTLFGADLYGTAQADKSDRDWRGLFLPLPETLVLGQMVRTLHLTTGQTDRCNLAEDLDLDLWSVQYWLKLLSAGDIGALDLIFAPSHPEAVIYIDSRLSPFFDQPLRLLDTIHSRAYADYSLKQAAKYGIKGSRLAVCRALQRYLQTGHLPPQTRLEGHLEALVEAGGDLKFCRLAEVQNRPGLYLGGKLFPGGLKITELRAWLEKEMLRYGNRAAEAEANRGLDVKALSHAIRALSQVREIFETGRLVFPLKNRAEITAIKEGCLTWAELSPLILERLAEVDRLKTTAIFQGRHETAWANRLLLACYGLALSGGTEASPRF